MFGSKWCAFMAAFLFILGAADFAAATVRLPKILGDNMVLQRKKEIKIWGWAASGEKINVNFNGQSLTAKASGKGTWSVLLKAMEHGGPFELTVSGKANTITLHNILIGDVWLGSGQSNMEWIMENTTGAEAEINAANFPNIRLFTVDKDKSYTVKDDLLGGQWLECNSNNVRGFSAVAYYFGKKLNQELDVPIGLINSSWGGTRVEPWISWEKIGKEPEYKDVKLAQMENVEADDNKKRSQYLAAMKTDKGLTEEWFKPESTVAGWKSIKLPQEWTHTEIGNTDGIVWFRKEFTLSAAEISDATLSIGPVDDIDYTYINGVQVGTVSNYSQDRIYQISKNLLKEGRNLLVVKVVDNQGGGGLWGKPDQLFLETKSGKVSLAGDWQWKSSILTSDFGIKDGSGGFPSFGAQLYNSMIAPFVSFPIKGVIWYQGESNAGDAYRYTKLFPMLINDWRSKWGYEFPFLWVQLANYMEAKPQPGESEWAELREAQRLTLALPKTGQAVILDIGEAGDIHPRNKKDVGIRLALNALSVEYGKSIVHSGPTYKAMETHDNQIVLTMDNAGSGLVAKGSKYGYLQGFAIAGNDKVFHWAKAYLDGNRIVVFSEAVKDPVAVRYAWADNPDDANLYNKEGLPASSFKTDAWKWVTDN
jgi:sialate O-acetylesterase